MRPIEMYDCELVSPSAPTPNFVSVSSSLGSPARPEPTPGETAHPESFCHRCLRDNVPWFTPNDIWNRVMPDDGIVCPVCFIQAAEQAGISPGVWSIAPGGPAMEERLASITESYRMSEENRALAEARLAEVEAERDRLEGDEGYWMGMYGSMSEMCAEADIGLTELRTLFDRLEARGVVSIYFADGSQLNPGSLSLRAALSALTPARPSSGETPP
jgi:hypothetical protein